LKRTAWVHIAWGIEEDILCVPLLAAAAASLVVAFPVLPAVVQRRPRTLPDGSASQLPREFTSFCDAS
jgi:hypothetical protein